MLDAIPAPIITHFLKEAESQNYRGFPSAGFSFFPTRDPELREFAGETGKGRRGLRYESRAEYARNESRAAGR